MAAKLRLEHLKASGRAKVQSADLKVWGSQKVSSQLRMRLSVQTFCGSRRGSAKMGLLTTTFLELHRFSCTLPNLSLERTHSKMDDMWQTLGGTHVDHSTRELQLPILDAEVPRIKAQMNGNSFLLRTELPLKLRKF